MAIEFRVSGQPSVADSHAGAYAHWPSERIESGPLPRYTAVAGQLSGYRVEPTTRWADEGWSWANQQGRVSFGRSRTGLDPRSSRVDRTSPEAIFGGDRGLAHLMSPAPCLGRGHRTCLHRTSKPRGWGAVRLPDVARSRVPRSTSTNRARTSASPRTVEPNAGNAAQQAIGAGADCPCARIHGTSRRGSIPVHQPGIRSQFFKGDYQCEC
jgi:hypothetical protein